MMHFSYFGILMTAYNSSVHVQSLNDRTISQSPIVLLHQKRHVLCSNVRIKLIVTKKTPEDESLTELHYDLSKV